MLPDESSVVKHPLDVRGIGRVNVFALRDSPSPSLALVIGKPVDGCLVRIQSSCIYGEVFGSVDCDCRDQLDTAVLQISDVGAGIVVYLSQEGRGAGLISKAEAYRRHALVGQDTFAAYAEMGLPHDLRDYDAAIRLLGILRINSVRLLTNNPDKVAQLERGNIKVHRVPLIVPVAEVAHEYLLAKKRQGHFIDGL